MDGPEPSGSLSTATATVGGLLGMLNAEERLGLVVAMLKHLESPTQSSASARKVHSIAEVLMLDKPSVELAELVGIRDAARLQQLTPPAEIKKETRDFGVQVTPPPIPLPPPRVYRDQASTTNAPPVREDAGIQTTVRKLVDRAQSPAPHEPAPTSAPQSQQLPAPSEPMDVDDDEGLEALSRKLTVARRRTAPELIVEQELLAFGGLVDALMHESPFESRPRNPRASAPPLALFRPPIASPTPARARTVDPTPLDQARPLPQPQPLTPLQPTAVPSSSTATEPTKKRKRAAPRPRPPTPPAFDHGPASPAAKRQRLNDASSLKRKHAAEPQHSPSSPEDEAVHAAKRRAAATQEFVPEYRSMRLLAREISGPPPAHPPPDLDEPDSDSPPVVKKRRGRPPKNKNAEPSESTVVAPSGQEQLQPQPSPIMVGVQPKRTYLGRRKSQDGLVTAPPDTGTPHPSQPSTLQESSPTPSQVQSHPPNATSSTLPGQPSPAEPLSSGRLGPSPPVSPLRPDTGLLTRQPRLPPASTPDDEDRLAASPHSRPREHGRRASFSGLDALASASASLRALEESTAGGSGVGVQPVPPEPESPRKNDALRTSTLSEAGSEMEIDRSPRESRHSSPRPAPAMQEAGRVDEVSVPKPAPEAPPDPQLFSGNQPVVQGNGPGTAQGSFIFSQIVPPVWPAPEKDEPQTIRQLEVELPVPAATASGSENVAPARVLPPSSAGEEAGPSQQAREDQTEGSDLTSLPSTPVAQEEPPPVRGRGRGRGVRARGRARGASVSAERGRGSRARGRGRGRGRGAAPAAFGGGPTSSANDSDSDEEYRPSVAAAGHTPRLPPRIRSSSQPRDGPQVMSPTSQIDALERRMSAGGVRQREHTPFEPPPQKGPLMMRIPALPHALPGAPYRAAPAAGSSKEKTAREREKEKDASTMLRDAVESFRSAPAPPPPRPKPMIGQGLRRKVSFHLPEGYSETDSS